MTRMCDVLRFIQNSHNTADLKQIKDEVDFYFMISQPLPKRGEPKVTLINNPIMPLVVVEEMEG